VTHGSLVLEIPVLEPDDELLERLATLAAGSRASSGVVPVAFGGPASRAVVVAATVAAVTAGAAAAATHLSQPRHVQPAPPSISVGIQRPEAPSPGVPHERFAASHTDAAAIRHPARPTSGDTTSDPGTHQHVAIQHSTANDPAAPGPHGPGGQQSANDSDDESGNDSGDQSGDTSGDQTGSDDGGTTDGGDGLDNGGTSDGGTSDGGTSDGGSQDGGSQDDEGTQAGSGDGSGAGSGRDPSSVLNGSSD
jgi:hypothetical protein